LGWGEFFALASALAWACAVILFRRSGKTLPAVELNLFKNSLSLLLLSLTILALYGPTVPAFTAHEVGVAVLSGILGMAVADSFYLKALNLMGAARTGIVSALYSPFVVLLSAIFLGETLSFLQWAGFLLVMAGIVLVTGRRGRTEVESADVKRGTLYAIFAMAAMAAGIVMVKELLEQRPFLWTVELRMLGGWAGLVLFITLRRGWPQALARYRQPQPWGLILMATLLASYIGVLLWLAGYKLIPASVAAILNETNASFIVLLAWLVLGESIGRRKLAGLLLTVAGVMLMLLS
jgi:drug/metabolite transporter (DMT)-like permease